MRNLTGKLGITCKWLKILGMILPVAMIIGLMTLFSSCCEDCPTCPDNTVQPYKGWLYATDGSTYYVYQIDTETDSLVDSVKYEGDYLVPGWITVSQDGRFLVVPYSNQLNDVYLTRVYDAQTLDVIMDMDDPTNPFFVDGGSRLLSHSCTAITHYSVPDFTVIGVDTILDPDSSSRAVVFELHEPENRIYMIVSCDPSRGDSTYIMAYDYQQREVVDNWIITDDNGDWVWVHNIEIHPDFPKLYLTMEVRNDYVYFACYDLEERQIVFKRPIDTFCGFICVSPDGNEVYLTDHGLGMSVTPNPGTLYVFDAYDGAYLHGISLFGYDPIQYRPLYAGYIVFTPTGEKAYVGSGLQGRRSGSVFCVNTSTRDITKLIWPDLGHYIYLLAIGPKL